MNVKKLKELIIIRTKIDAQNDILTEENHNYQLELLCDNLQETMKFLNECSSEEFYWLSELFESLSEYYKSQELIDCMKANAIRTKNNVLDDIKYAEEVLKH